MSGGLRRASEAGFGVDVARAEHEQSLSDSTVSFVKCGAAVDAESLRRSLAQRDERALLRIAGFDLANALMAMANAQEGQCEARFVFEKVVRATGAAIRGTTGLHGLSFFSGGEDGVALIDDPRLHDGEQMEAHYLTDLTGCKVELREAVARRYEFLLCSVSGFLQATLHRLKQSKRNARMARLMMKLVALDYVEADYDMLAASGLASTLRSALTAPEAGPKASVTTVAWKLLELLIKRCICDGGKGFASGNSLQQLLLDVLVLMLKRSLLSVFSFASQAPQWSWRVPDFGRSDDATSKPADAAFFDQTDLRLDNEIITLQSDPLTISPDGAISFSLFLDEQTFRHGVIFSIGNPQHCSYPEQEAASKYIPASLNANDDETLPAWTFLQVGIDANRRITMKIATLAGASATAVCDTRCSFGAQVDVHLRISQLSSLIVRLATEETVVVERFPGIMENRGESAGGASWNATQRSTPVLEVGMRVFVKAGLFEGVVGRLESRAGASTWLVVLEIQPFTLTYAFAPEELQVVLPGSNLPPVDYASLLLKMKELDFFDMMRPTAESSTSASSALTKQRRFSHFSLDSDNDDEQVHGSAQPLSTIALHAPLYIGRARSSALGVAIRYMRIISCENSTASSPSSSARQVFHSRDTEPTAEHGGVIQGEDTAAAHEPQAIIGPALLVLSLCHTVCRSPVGRARLTAPYPLELLLSSSLAVRGPLELRVSCTRLMRTMMADISISTASACALRVIDRMAGETPDLYRSLLLEVRQEDPATGRAFLALLEREIDVAMSVRPSTGLKRLAADAFTMAVEYIELLQQLCERPAWAAVLAAWVLEGVEKQSPTALSLLGGIYQGCRVGGRAWAGDEEVCVLAKAWVKDGKEREASVVTKDVKVEVSSDAGDTARQLLNESDSCWQSNGHTPHWVRLTLPPSLDLAAVRMLGCASDAYSPAAVTISAGPRNAKLRTLEKMTLRPTDDWITLASDKLRRGDAVFQIDIQSNHKRGCDSRIRAFQVLATSTRPSRPLPSLVVARIASDDSAKALDVLQPHGLRPMPLAAPMALLDALDESQSNTLVAALMRAIASADLDVRVRCLKVMEAIGRHERVGALIQEAAVAWLMREQARLQRPRPLRSLRKGLRWEMDAGSARKWRVEVEEEAVTFQPAGRVHRAVTLGTAAMVRGKHVWEMELAEDIATDETSLFGVTALPAFIAEGTELNVLAPCEDLWLVRSFNGHRYHVGSSTNWAGAEALRMHPKDVVKCEYDADHGCLSVAVNAGPMIKVFDNVGAPWGLRPCVASYGNREPVTIKILSFQSTHIDSSQQRADSAIDAYCAMIVAAKDDQLVEARYAQLLTFCYNQSLAVTVTAQEGRSGRVPDVEEELPLISDESDDEEEEDGAQQLQQQQQQQLVDESQPMVQKVAALFEVKDEKQEKVAEDTGAVRTGIADEIANPMIADLMNNSLFNARPEALQRCVKYMLTDLFSRQLSRTLASFFEQWLARSHWELPDKVIRPANLQHTMHLIYSACDEQHHISSMDEVTSNAALAAERLCSGVSPNGENLVHLLLKSSIDMLQRVGGRLLQEAKAAKWEAEKAREARTRQEEAVSASASSRPGSRKSPAFKIGAQVEARFMGHRRWYPGRISGVNPDGTYQIDYHDSDQETHVPQAYIRPRRGMPAGRPGDLVVGDLVDARFRGKAKWYPGRVSSVNANGTFDIQYHDGDFESNVPMRLIRPSASGPALHPPMAEPALSQPQPPTQRQQPVLEDFSKSDEPGSVLLVADRFKGVLPEDGKPDSAQVSIINHPVEADGVVKTIKLRLADQPSGGSDRWEVLLFERAGESSTFFVVSSTPEQPNARSHIYLDPNCLTDQVAEVETKLVVLQGQYIGVMNSAGRLNVSYTPGKKKSCESWALKPVEVFYLMPRSVPNPFVGGPYRTKLWHGRAGWCATVQISSNGVATAHSLQLNKRIDDLLISRPGSSAISVAAMLKHCSWVLLLLLKQEKVTTSELFKHPGLIQALRRLCEHGLFLMDRNRSEGRAHSSALWDHLLHLIAHLCTCAQREHENSGTRIPPSEAAELIRLQRCFEIKANEVNRMRHQTLRLRSRGFKDQAATSVRLQRLLRCLVLLDALTRKNCLVDDHRPAQAWTEIRCTLPAEGAPIIRYEVNNSRLFISDIIKPQQNQPQAQKHAVFQLQVGDELIEVNHRPLAQIGTDEELLNLAVSCPRKDGSRSSLESEQALLERLSSSMETVVINGVMLHTTESWLDDSSNETALAATTSKQVHLLFRRQTEGTTEPRLAENTAGITYKGVRRANAQSHSWLDAMMTASELSHALSTRSLPPARFLSSLFTTWRQRSHAVNLPSAGQPADDHSDYVSAASDDGGGALQVRIPGAVALKLSWDSRSCVGEGRLVVSSTGRDYGGADGTPPNVSVVSGSEISVWTKERHRGDKPGAQGVHWSERSGGGEPWRMAGLQNRAGAFMRLGSAPFCRAVLYCGRKATDIVGWTNEHGRCGPHGGPQCPDCADYIARNHCGNAMMLGGTAKAKGLGMGVSARKARAVKWVDDLLYCNKKCNPKSKIPCVNCCKFLSVMIRTEGHTNIPSRLPGQFSSARAYEHFLSNIVCVGIKLRVSPTHPSDLRNLIGTVMAAERAKPCVLRFTLDNPKHTHKVATFAYKDLLLCSVQEVGGIDARGAGQPDDTVSLPEPSSSSFRPPRQSSAPASRGLSQRRMAMTGAAAEGHLGAADLEDDLADGDPDQANSSAHPLHQFLEASDFGRESLYAEYMLRYCTVGTKVRCVRTYENIEEGDIGIVQAIDAPDDLPCQALWESTNSLYWLPWSNLSLNVRPPPVASQRSPSTSLSDAMPHDEDWSNVCFDKSSLGPDIELFNGARTATRTRADGWGTQRLNHFVDVKHSALKVVLRVDENGSNHLLIGAIAQPFATTPDAYKRSMMERFAWCLRADGSIYADGKQVQAPAAPMRIASGDTITICIDISNPARRSISFLHNGALLGEAAGLPARVSPAVSFGGSFQRVSIVFVQAGPAGGSSFNALPGWGFHLRVEPVFPAFNAKAAKTKEDQERFQAFVDMHASWTRRQDESCIAYVNSIVARMDIPLDDLLELSFMDIHSLDPQSSHNSESLHPLLQKLVVDRAGGEVGGDEDDGGMAGRPVDLEEIAQRYEVLRALNVSVVRGLGLLDLSGWRTQGSPGFALSECSSLLLNCFKFMLWNDALGVTRTQLHQFEVVLDLGKAMSRSNVADVHARHTVFAQAFRTMNGMPPKLLRAHGKLYNATLRGMGSHDDGGPYRQSFSQYCKELQSLPGVGLLLPCSNRANQIHINQDKWLPNPSARSPLQLEMFQFLGKLMGIAIRNKEYLDLRLPSLLWKQLVQQVPSTEDLRAVDLLTVSHIEERSVFFASGAEVDEGTEAVSTFSVYGLDGRLHGLVANGKMKPVTAENVETWAQMTLEFKLHEFDEQIEAIQRGLAAIVPQKLLLLFTWQELEMMVCGHCQTDIGLLKAKTVYVDCAESEPHIRYFWNVLNSFTEEQRSDYIKFVWGRARLPMQSEAWEQPHKITPFTPPAAVAGKPPTKLDDCLPYAHTCYFTIDLPRYSTEEILRNKLLFAIENCPEIDGDQTDIGLRSAAMGFHIVSDDESSTEGDGDQDAELLSPSYMAQELQDLNASSLDSQSEDIDPLNANLYPYRFSLLSTHSDDSDASLDEHITESAEDENGSISIDNYLEVDSMYIA